MNTVIIAEKQRGRERKRKNERDSWREREKRERYTHTQYAGKYATWKSLGLQKFSSHLLRQLIRIFATCGISRL